MVEGVSEDSHTAPCKERPCTHNGGGLILRCLQRVPETNVASLFPGFEPEYVDHSSLPASVTEYLPPHWPKIFRHATKRKICSAMTWASPSLNITKPKNVFNNDPGIPSPSDVWACPGRPNNRRADDPYIQTFGVAGADHQVLSLKEGLGFRA